MNAAFTLLYKDILQYPRYQSHVARLDTLQMKAKDARNKKTMVSKSCLQFHHIKLGGNESLTHWVLLHCYPLSDSMVECHVYDTLGQHELDFEALSHIAITKNLRISYCSCCR